MTKTLLRHLACLVLLALLALPAARLEAKQPETAVTCDDNGEPQPDRAPIAYGQHTEGCRVDGPANRDNFTFAGAAGDLVRFLVRSTTLALDPRLEVRDPDGTVLVDTSCNGNAGPGGAALLCSVSVDKTLPLAGTYTVAVSDTGVDEAGSYILQLERIPPTFDPPSLPYDSPIPVRDVINLAPDVDFFAFDGVANSQVRLIVSSKTPGFDPRLEVRDPAGNILVDTFCNGNSGPGGAAVQCSISIDEALPLTGPYLVLISDANVDEAGTYELTLNCLFACEATPVNSAPELDPIGNLEFEKNTARPPVPIRAQDRNGDHLTFSATGLPPGATLVDHGDGTATFWWTPSADQPADIPPVTFTVSDGQLTDSETVAIKVQGGNRPPQLAGIADQQVAQGTFLPPVSVSATDPDGNGITLTAMSRPSGASFVDNGNGTGTFTWQPAPGQLGTFFATFRAQDNGVPPLDDVQTMVIHVQEPEAAVVCGSGGEPVPDRAPIAYGQHTEGCRVDGPADRDNFTFAGAAGDLVRFLVRSTTLALDPRLEVRDPDGTVLVDTSCNGNAGPGGAALLCSVSVDKTLPLAGTYTVAVSDTGVDEAGSYILQLERIPPTFDPPSLPYDSPIPVRDVINLAPDVDFFAFHGVANSQVRLIVSSRTPGFDPRLEVRDPAGNILVDTFCNGNSGPGGAAVQCSISIDEALPLTGPYLVLISDANVNEAGTYELTLLCVFGACAAPPPCSVPSVIGLSKAGAKAAIVAADLVVGTITKQCSATVLAGIVISQEPAPGTAVFCGTPVNLVISSGTCPPTVPPVVGLPKAEAKAKIIEAGLVVGTSTKQCSATVPPGNVVSQDPEAGTPVDPGSPVHLVISRGPSCPVPPVAGLPEVEARAKIIAAGLAVGPITRPCSATVPTGIVIGQDPAAGTPVSPDSPVSLVISSGSTCLVPDVVGLPKAEAKAKIIAAGLVVGTTTKRCSASIPIGHVVSQNPAAGTPLSPGSPVSLVISSGPTCLVPPVVGLPKAEAKAKIIAAGLAVGTSTKQCSASVPTVGSVVSQDPVAGTPASPGSPVNLVISRGPSCSVPPVAGLPEAEAREKIIAAGLVVGPITTPCSASVPTGIVISQAPTASTPVNPGSPVSLVISSGPTCLVPPVVGLPKAEAKAKIIAAGLVVGTTTKQCSAPTVGSVVSQDPAAGTPVSPGGPVNLVISRGPACLVPSVVNMPKADATARIVAAGLVVGDTPEQCSTVTADNVISQDPAAGTSASLGSAVALVVSNGACDNMPPLTTILTGPPETIKTTSATFTWTGSDDATPTESLTYAFRLEPLEAHYSSFTSATTKTYSGLGVGTYTFHVKAQDLALNEASPPASWEFKVRSPLEDLPAGTRP